MGAIAKATRRRAGVLLLSVALTALASCRPQGPGLRATDYPSNVTAYNATGVVEKFMPDGRTLRITHEEIPGYMDAMTMDLEAKQTNEFAGLTAGDRITFRLLVTESDGWIDRLRRTGTPAALAATNPPPPPIVVVDELEPGAPLPDCTLTNQSGRALRLGDFKGRALAITFIFTRCPFPVYCPRMGQNFAAAQRELAAGSATNWHLLSISFDPEFDTPARLAAYGKSYQQDPARWTFATGPTEDIRRLGGAFGLAFWKSANGFDHNVRTVVVDRAGRVQKIFRDNQWQPAELVKELKQAMGDVKHEP